MSDLAADETGNAPWAAVLRGARARTRLTQRELAERSGVSETAISRYERGHTRPSRRAVLRLARGGGFDSATTNELLLVAGHLPLGPLHGDGGVPLAALFREAGTCSWPCLALTKTADVAAWNEPANRVAELDFARDLPMRHQRSLIHLAMLDHFADGRICNGDDVLQFLARIYRSSVAQFAGVEYEPIYVQHLLTHLAEEHAARFAAFRRLLLRTAARQMPGRKTQRVEWRLDDGTKLNFTCVIAPWGAHRSTYACDWFPADASTWRWLDRTAPAPLGDRAPFEAAIRPTQEQPAANSVKVSGFVGQLLRGARDYLGLSRPQAARDAGIAVDTLLSIERGRRRPTADSLKRLAQVLQLDAVMLNTVRVALGMDAAEPQPTNQSAAEPVCEHDRRDEREPTTAITPERLQQTIDNHPWPCLIVDRRCVALAENTALRRLFGRSLADPASPRAARQLLTILLSRSFREHAPNWRGFVATLIGASPSAGGSGGADAGQAPPTRALLARLGRRDPALATALAAMASANAASQTGARLVFRLRWNDEGGIARAFICVFSCWSEQHGLWALDWHPADARTWEWLTVDPRLSTRSQPARPGSAVAGLSAREPVLI